MSIAEKLTTIAENVQRVYDAGFENGVEKGKEEAAGENADFYDQFWDVYQDNGTRTDYQNAFSYGGWRNAAFKPKYPLTNITNALSMFARCRLTRITVPLDLSKCTNCSFMFNNAMSLQKITSITFSSSSVNGSNMFASCGSLVDITVNGVIPFDIVFGGCPLSKDSILSVFNALSTDATGKTCTFKKSAVNSAFETSEGANDGSTSDEWTALVATKTNWTIALA